MYIHIEGGFSAFKKNKIMTPERKRKEREIIIVNEINVTPKGKYYMFYVIRAIQKERKT